MKTLNAVESPAPKAFNPEIFNALVAAAIGQVKAGARDYLQVHGLTADPEVLSKFCRFWCKALLPQAMSDARAALECNMGKAAGMSFSLTMRQAGIEAAKCAGALWTQPNGGAR